MAATTWRNLLIVAAVCAIVGLVVLPIGSPETGSTADVLFAVQAVVLIAGAVSLAMALIRWRGAKSGS